MAIVKAPLKTDATGKCSRWRVIIYNPSNGKQEWHTIAGTRRDAKEFERQAQGKLARGTHVPKAARLTVRQLVAAFIADRRSRGKRSSTVACYRTAFNKHVLADDHRLADRSVDTVRRNDFADLFTRMLEGGASASTVNRALRASKALMFFAMERELIERSPLQRYSLYKRLPNDPGRRANRGAYREAEARALLTAAQGPERPFVGLLMLSGIRPGEVYALRVIDLDLEGGAARVTRSWDHVGHMFVTPKTEAGSRTVPLAPWLVAELRAHIQREGLEGEALLFTGPKGKPLGPKHGSALWYTVVNRAGVRKLDGYSSRHTFASLARVSGQVAFNVTRAIGHTRSSVVDQTYAHTMDSGLASVAAGVADRVFPVTQGQTDGRGVREPLEGTAEAGEKKTA